MPQDPHYDRLLFSKRQRLAELFEEWRLTAGVRPLDAGAFNVITFLSGNDLLDAGKVKQFLQSKESA